MPVAQMTREELAKALGCPEMLKLPERRRTARDCEASVMWRAGDSKYIWDPSNEAEVEIAKAMFEKFKKKGFNAFSVKGKDGDKGDLMREFDPEAGRVIFAPQLAGG